MSPHVHGVLGQTPCLFCTSFSPYLSFCAGSSPMKAMAAHTVLVVQGQCQTLDPTRLPHMRAWLTAWLLWSRPSHRGCPTNPLSLWLIYWAVTVSSIIQPMELPFPLIVILFAFIVFQMSGIFKCGEPCNHSFSASQGLSHHRRSCQIFIRRKMELLDTWIELNRSNHIFQEQPAKRARVSLIDANDLVHPLDLSGFVWSSLCHMT